MASPITFLFWNLSGQQRADIVGRLTRVHEVDVVVLAECAIRPGKLLTELNVDGVGYTRPFSQCEALDVYVRFPRSFLTPVLESSRVSIRRLHLPARTEILLAMMHLPSKSYRSETGQTLAATQYVRLIEEAERIAGHTRTVVMGDLNMNPFEPGMVGAGGFHAVSSRGVAARDSREVDGTRFQFFYNPMWGHFGDRDGGPPGSYYYARGEPHTLFWHILDQVLIRPSLLEAFHDRDMHILTTDGAVSFTNARGLPDKAVASDHLPLLFRLYL